MDLTTYSKQVVWNLVMWAHCLIVFILPCSWHVIKYILKFFDNGFPFILTCRAIFHVQRNTNIHDNCKNFFPLCYYDSHWFQGSTLSRPMICSSHFALMNVNISICSQLGCCGFFNWTSIDTYEPVFFLSFVICFLWKSFFNIVERYMYIDLQKLEYLNIHVLVLFFCIGKNEWKEVAKLKLLTFFSSLVIAVVHGKIVLFIFCTIRSLCYCCYCFWLLVLLFLNTLVLFEHTGIVWTCWCYLNTLMLLPFFSTLVLLLFLNVGVANVFEHYYCCYFQMMHKFVVLGCHKTSPKR